MRARNWIAAVAVLVWTATVPVAAFGAFPGVNGRVYFTTDRLGTSTSTIWSAAADGSDAVQITTELSQIPAVSPDGLKLVYGRFADSRPTLAIADSDGSSAHALVPPTNGADLEADWSPDNHTIIFSSSRPDGAAYRLWKVQDDGGGLTPVTSTFAGEPAWSPDGTKIAFIGADAGLTVMNADGSNAHRITTSDQSESSPTWSPDGTRIAFGRYTDWPTTDAHEIYTVDVDSGREQQLTTGGFINRRPRWSPDGQEILFQRKLDVLGTFELYTVQDDGAELAPFITSPGSNLLAYWAVQPEGVAPTVTLTTPADGATYSRGAVVAADYACSDEDGGSGIRSCTAPIANGDPVDTGTAGTKTFTVTATDRAGNTTSVTHSYTVADLTAPTITITTPADGAVFGLGEFVQPVFGCTDESGGSGIDYCHGPGHAGERLDTFSIGVKSFTVQAADKAGNPAQRTHTYTVVDRTPPGSTIYAPRNGATYFVGDGVLADYVCADQQGGSGLVSCDGTAPRGSPIDTSTPGLKTFTVRMADLAGNRATESATYSVVYRFGGFSSPVSNFPALNTTTAGKPVPVKFSLDGDQGLAIFGPGSPTSVAVPCDSFGETSGGLSATGALTYNTSTTRYTYSWNTDKNWAGTCRELVFMLRDGSTRRAVFKLTK